MDGFEKTLRGANFQVVFCFGNLTQKNSTGCFSKKRFVGEKNNRNFVPDVVFGKN
jgi:hypothetical protein